MKIAAVGAMFGSFEIRTWLEHLRSIGRFRAHRTSTPLNEDRESRRALRAVHGAFYELNINIGISEVVFFTQLKKQPGVNFWVLY